MARILQNFKISQAITVVFFSLASIFFLANIIAVRWSLNKNLSDELLSRSEISARDLARDASDLLMTGEAYKITDVFFDEKNGHSDVAYIFLADSPNSVAASTFINFGPDSFDDWSRLTALGRKKAMLTSRGGKQIYDIAEAVDYSRSILHVGFYKSRLEDTINKTIHSLLLSFLLPPLFVVVLAVFFARSILWPLQRLKRAAQKISEGDMDEQIESFGKNEIGELSEVIGRMVGDIRDSRSEIENYSRNLETEVDKKTVELKKALDNLKEDKNAFEIQRQAMLNILDDTAESQKELERSNEDLKEKSRELAALKSLSDDLAGILDIEEAVKILNDYFLQFINFDAATYLVFSSGEEGGIVYQCYLKKQIGEKMLDAIGKSLKAYVGENHGSGRESAEKIVEQIRPQLWGEKLDNKMRGQKELVLSHFPMAAGETGLGVIQFANASADDLKKKEEFIKAMIVTTSLSIDRLETLIRTQHYKTISLVESLSDGVIMFNSKAEIILLNPAVLKCVSMSKEGFSLPGFYKLWEEVDLKTAVDEALREGKTSHINEAKLINSYFEIFVTPVKESGGGIAGGAIILHDITFLKEIDRMKTEFVSVASHQLRTPLTAVKLFTEMLARGEVGPVKKEQKEYLDNINQSTDRMVRLVNDLLNITRIESGRLRIEPVPTDVCDFVKNIVEETMPLAEMKKIKLSYASCPAGSAILPLDVNLFRQVIHNLIVNAIRYSLPEHGKVEVAIEINKQKNYIFSVKDNGIGIPEAAQKRIFEKFYRADNAVKAETEGTGLGLYVSKMIVESSGGKMRFESREGLGTTFIVSMPGSGMPVKKGERGLVIS
jgi:signal transduction histidine kinase